MTPRLFPLLALFGALYFVQGIIEPTACLPAQPLQSQLRAWNFSTEQVGHFFGIIGIAWSIKPLFGLISDLFPLAGRRRWPYLVLSTAGAAAAFFTLAAIWTDPPPRAGGWTADAFHWLTETTPNQPDISRIGWLLVFAGISIAMTDVTIDALAVESGQPAGLTGQIQSVQWGALSVAALLAGALGGYVAQHQLQRLMFTACGSLALASLAVVLLTVREPPQARRPADYFRQGWRQLWTGRQPLILASAAAFLFLWNFNPFSGNVMQAHMTTELGLSEQFYGYSMSVQGVGMIAACLAYGWYCRKVPFGHLIHLAIIAGVISTLTFWLLRDRPTAILASFVFGLAWQTGTLVQLDLAARVAPLATAATAFALLMAISNTGMSFGIYLGGGWYDGLAANFQGNRHQAFHTLVAIGAAFTATCWLLVPALKWSGVQWNK
jgi:MFS family permease